jgi:hypothetical protein
LRSQRKNDRHRRWRTISAPMADRPDARRNLSFGKLAAPPHRWCWERYRRGQGGTHAHRIPLPVPSKRAPWNKGRLIGQKRPLKPKDVWAIRVRLQLQDRKPDLALFNLALDSKLRGCDLVRLQVDDVCAGGSAGSGYHDSKKTGGPVQFEITEQTRASIHDWLSKVELRNGRYLFPSPTASLYSAIR